MSGARPAIRFARDGVATRTAWGVAGVVGVVCAWHAVVAAGLVSERALPTPAVTADAAIELLGDDTFLEQLRETMEVWLVAVVVTTAITIPIGLVIGYFRFWERSTALAIDVFRSVPPAALIPIAISMFGLGFDMKVILVSFAISWLILVNTIYGVRAIDPMTLTVARSLRWTRRQTFVRAILPSASPYISTGIRIGASVAFVVTLSAELLGAGSGVGTMLNRYAEVERTDAVYAGIVIVGVIGIAMNVVIVALERRVLRWNVERQRR